MKNEPPDMTELNEMLRAFNESGDDFNREFVTALVGNDTESLGMHTITVIRGKPMGTIWPNGQSANDGIIDKYNALNDFYLKGMPPNPPYDDGLESRDIGPVEAAWFVIADDCGPLENDDEWNALMNGRPNSKEIWQRRKISYYEFWGRVLDMKIKPPDPNQKYHWYDRTD